MCLIFKCRRSVNSNGLTMTWGICYSAAAEMKLNKPKKCVQESKRVSTTDFNKVSNGYVTDWRSHMIYDQQMWDSTLLLHKSDYLKCNVLNTQI